MDLSLTARTSMSAVDVSDFTTIRKAVARWPQDWRDYFAERAAAYLADEAHYVALTAERCAYRDTLRAAGEKGVALVDGVSEHQERLGKLPAPGRRE